MTFVNTETIRKAYLGKHAQELLLQSSEQVRVVYEQRGIVIPVVVSSVLHFIYTDPRTSLADISKGLKLPHQLVAQRIEKLDRLGLIEKHPDPADKRRSEFHLTSAGRQQAMRLKQCMEDTALVYSDLYDEIGCDLAQALLDAINALERKPLSARFAEKFEKLEEYS